MVWEVVRATALSESIVVSITINQGSQHTPIFTIETHHSHTARVIPLIV